MFNVFGISVDEGHETVTVTGFNGNALMQDVTKMWKTSVLEKHMFKEFNWRKISFYKFYTLDVIYMLESLINGKMKGYQNVPKRTLSQIVDAIKQQTWYKDTVNPQPDRLDFSKLKEFAYQPKEYQQGFFDYYNKTPPAYHLKGALLSGTPGSGKTFQSMCTMILAGMEKVIVLCPKTAINRAWELDIQGMFKKPPKYWTTLMNTPPTEDTQVFVYHYEALNHAIEHHKNWFRKYKYGMILDESHNLNDIKAQRTQNWISLCKMSGSQNIIHASGTPLKALGSESIPLLRVIDPMFTPKVEETFKKIYGISGTRGLDILQNRLNLISYKIEKHQLGLDKPIMIQKGIQIPEGKKYTLTAVKEAMLKFTEERYKYYKARQDDDLAFYKKCLAIHESTLRSGKDRAAYQQYLDDVKLIQRTREYHMVSLQISRCKSYEFSVISKSLPQADVKAFRSVCSIIKYLPLKIQGECLGNVVGRLRIEAHKAMCDHIPFMEICESTTKKTVVFTSYVEVLEDAQTACSNQGLDPIVVYAKTNAQLPQLIHDFENNPRKNPIIATYSSLSTAVPLVMADTMIMINAPFRAYIQEQAISRIHRLRQTTQTTVYQLALDTGSEPNISSRSLDIMKWSQEQVEAMTGIKSPYTLSDSDVEDKTAIESLVSLEALLPNDLAGIATESIHVNHRSYSW